MEALKPVRLFKCMYIQFQRTQFLGLHKPTNFDLSPYEPIKITPAPIILIFVFAQFRVAVFNLGILYSAVPVFINLFTSRL